MSNSCIQSCAAGVLLLALASAAQAEPSYTWNATTGPVQAISALHAEGAAGVLVGVGFSATFSDGSRSSVLFSDASSPGGPSGTHAVAQVPGLFRMQVQSATGFGSGVSFPSFTLDNLSSTLVLASFSFDALATPQNGNLGRAVFDREDFFGSLPSTAGSGSGNDVLLVGGHLAPSLFSGTVTVQYAFPVALGEQAPVGDLYRALSVDLSQFTAFGGLAPGLFIGLSTDIDSVIYGAATPVPEPAPWALLALGLLALRRRRRPLASGA